MAVVNRVVVEMLNVVERAADIEARASAGTQTSSTMAATLTSPAPSATTSSSGGSNGPTSSPLLFFVALGFGVVFTNLWIIVGVKYCFRYNARNRQMRVGEDGEPINLENIPRPHRRRREKKLMSMDEVNERFPLLKYKTWVASRASEGLPTTGGVTAPASRAASLRSIDGIEPELPSATNSTDDKSVIVSREVSDDSRATTAEGTPRSESRQSTTDSEKGVASHVEPDSLSTLKEVKTTTSTLDPKQAIAAEEEDEDDEENIHAAVPPELLQNPGDSCAICIDTLEDDDDVRGLTCGHAFHASCLDPWLTSRRACCPLCKADYFVPKPRPDGEPSEPERDSRRHRRMESNNRRMNMPQAPTSAWTGARGSPFRGPRMILPGRFMTNPMYSSDGHGYTSGGSNGRRRRGMAAGQQQDLGAADQPVVDSTWRSRVRLPNPFSNLRMPAMPGRNRQQNTAGNPTPAQLEEGATN